ACGNCSYCRAGYYAQCDDANPSGKQAGTAFFGGPANTGSFHGLQAEKARIPYANVGLIKLPDAITDDQAILLSDIFPTGYFGAELAEVTSGDTVAVFGCGPVGQFAIASAFLLGAARVFAIDKHADRLRMARQQGAEIINFDEEEPVEALLRLTKGIGVDRAIDAVGVDAEHRHSHGEQEQRTDKNWQPGDGPSQALEWAIKGLAKAGTLGIIGVYAEDSNTFPIGLAMNKNLTINMGNCHHRKYIPRLIELTLSGRIDPSKILTQVKPMSDVIEAFKAFDQRRSGWVKVELHPQPGSRPNGEDESMLDDALEDTFPASDPPSMTRRSGHHQGFRFLAITTDVAYQRCTHWHLRLAICPFAYQF